VGRFAVMTTRQAPSTFDVMAVRARFPALARTGLDGRPFVWADAPGGSQAPDSVIDAVAARMAGGASNTHGSFPLSEEIDSLIAEAHRAGAGFLGCDPDEVVFGQNATSLLLHLSRSFSRTLGPGDELVVTRLDHDANVRPWIFAARDAGATVRWVDVRDDDVTLDLESFDRQLSDRTRLVAFTLASNAVGTITPAAEIVRRAHGVGALAVADAVHLAPHRLLDFHALEVDLLFCSPYKFYGPHLGVMAGTRDLLSGLQPDKVRPATDDIPDRWETGTKNHEGLAGLVAAVDYLASLGVGSSRRHKITTAMDRISMHEAQLSDRLLRGLPPDVCLLGIADPDRVAERAPTFALRLSDRHPRDDAEAFAKRGIFVWDGDYYAMAIMERLGLSATGGATRIGFCHYHTLDEVERVLEATAEIARA
jgi:cysteine desulfurase family protein (TIGR01976 family)